MTAPPRAPAERRRDTLHRLETDVDAWVATADESGAPYLIPLSFLWDGETVVVATPAASRTGRNLRPGEPVRVGIGPTRDVVLLDGVVADSVPVREAPGGMADAFAARTGFDPRELDTEYRYYRIRPRRIQAWREANELSGRDLMRDGRWVVPEEPSTGG